MRLRRTLKTVIPTLTAISLVAVVLTGCHLPGRKSRVLARAESYFQSGAYDKAKIEYLNVLRLDHDNVRAFQQLGFIWYEQGAPLRAIPFLRKVKELAPSDIPARTKLVLALVAIGQPTEGRKEAISILEQDPGNADAILILVGTSRTQDEIAQANQQLQKFPQKESAAFHLASADVALRTGDAAGASEQLRQALAAEPNSPRPHLAMAYVYQSQKDSNHADQEFKAAAELAPLRSNERIKYAEFQFANGTPDQATATLENITKQAPDYLPAWRGLAQIAVAQKNYDSALTLLENIFSRDSDNPEARLLQSEVWMAKGDSAKAIAVLNRLDTTYPNTPIIKFQLARAYTKDNNLNQAGAELERAIAINPDYTEAIFALAELNLRTGKPTAVAPAMEALLKKRPDLWQARVMLSSAYQALGRLDEAAELFRQEIKIAPRSFQAYVLLGLVLRQEGKASEARQAFEKASEIIPDDVNPINQLVGMDLAEQQYAAANERVRRQLEKKPDDASSHFLEARVAAAQQDWPRAEAALQKTLELNRDLAPAYDLLASVYLAMNKLPEAIAQLEKSLEKNPNNPAALMLEGTIYEKMSEFQKASDVYEKLIALNPTAAAALNNLAYVDSEYLNQLDRAYELAQKAHTLAPNEAAISDTLGWILYKRGDYQRALPLLQDSAAKMSDNPSVEFHLGMTSYMMGQTDAAQTTLERAVRSNADFRGKDEAQRRLALVTDSAKYAKEGSTGQLEALSKQQPNDPIVAIRLAEAYQKGSEPGKAAAIYEGALQRNPNLLVADLALAQLYAGALHKPDKALEIAKKARELAPGDARAAGILGRVAFEANNFTWADSLLEESVRELRTDPQVLHDFALATYALGKVPEARQLMQRSIEASPSPAQTEDAKEFLFMTAFDRSSGNLSAAEPQIKAILQKRPDYVPALMAQAAIQSQRNDQKTAGETYSEILRHYPDFAPAQKELAEISAENPDGLAQAYELAMKARKTLPNDPELARTLAEISFKRREFQYAIQLFQESARKTPLPAADLYYLGMAQLQTAQEAEGRETLQQALTAGLKDPLAQEAKRRLAEKRATN